MPEKKKSDSAKPTIINPHENSSLYKKNEITGEWEVKNPSGSIAYNYLYRGDYEEEDITDDSILAEKDKNR